MSSINDTNESWNGDTLTYADEDSIDPELFCSICQGPYLDPVAHSLCSNMFCTKCINNVSTCPLCRKSLKDSLIPAPRPILNILDKLKVSCRVCSQPISRGELSAHLGFCPVLCSLGCGERVPPKEKQEHETNRCSNKITPCPAFDVGCSYSGARSTQEDHIEGCRFVAMKPMLLLMKDEMDIVRKQLREEIAAEFENYKKQSAKEIEDLKAQVRRLQFSESAMEPKISKKIYVIAGWDGSGVLNSVECFSPIENTWSTVASMPTKRYQFGVAVYNDLIYVVGGHNGASILNTVERFNPSTNRWDNSFTLNTRRFQFVSGVQGYHIYVIGGSDGGRDLSSGERFNLLNNRWETIPDMNCQRSDCGLGIVGEQLYVFGGHDGNSALTSGELFDSRAQRWSRIASMISRRRYFGVGVIRDSIYAIGGNDGNVILNTVERYDTRMNKWEAVEPLPTCRAGCGVGNFGSSMFIIGGYDGSTRVKSVLSYDANAGWQTAPSMSTKRSALGVATV